jgi:hypothetical protein
LSILKKQLEIRVLFSEIEGTGNREQGTGNGEHFDKLSASQGTGLKVFYYEDLRTNHGIMNDE